MREPRIAVIGHDLREWYAACTLQARGYETTYVGRVPARGHVGPNGVAQRAGIGQAIAGCSVIVGPVRGLFEHQEQQLQENLAMQRAPAWLFCGQPSQRLQQAASARGWTVVDLQQSDWHARLNAVPTAEGAVLEAALNSERTIWQSRCVVIGYGRVGSLLAHRLQAWGARIVVATADERERVHALVHHEQSVTLSSLKPCLADADFVFNTIPAPICNADVLSACKSDALLVELASPPGGIDRTAAEQLGLHLHFAPGLPGKWSPRTAGEILADTVIAHLCSGRQE